MVRAAGRGPSRSTAQVILRAVARIPSANGFRKTPSRYRLFYMNGMALRRAVAAPAIARMFAPARVGRGPDRP